MKKSMIKTAKACTYTKVEGWEGGRGTSEGEGGKGASKSATAMCHWPNPTGLSPSLRPWQKDVIGEGQSTEGEAGRHCHCR